MIDYKKIFKNRELRLKIIKLLSFIPTKIYLKIIYRIRTGKRLNLKNPKGFNEKLQWLKVNNKNPNYTELVDKIKVREYIKNKIGEEYLFPIYGFWKTFDDIDFSKLPNSFVLKCSHDSGSVKIIKDKKLLSNKDYEQLSKFYKGRLKLNPYCLSREYPYKNVEPFIIAEKYMISSENEESGINDYKFFCFNGVPQILMIISGRQKKDVGGYREDFVDMNYNKLPITNGEQCSEVLPDKPKNFEKMKELATLLSKDMPHVRLDFYELDGNIYFGEFTFFSAGGLILFEPDEWEEKMGNWININ